HAVLPGSDPDRIGNHPGGARVQPRSGVGLILVLVLVDIHEEDAMPSSRDPIQIGSETTREALGFSRAQASASSSS
ncbi:hypothetical protein CTI14_69855, partial [Methylobacterium radiotolerans]